MKTTKTLAAGSFTCLVLMNLLWMPTHGAVTITSAVITGPATIVCPPNNKVTYTLTVTGTGATNVADWFWFSIYDDDNNSDKDAPWYDSDMDDLLQKETPWEVTGSGGWTKSMSFDLWCEEHVIRGISGTSSERTAEVYAKIESYYLGADLLDTVPLSVTCIPEPVGPFGLLGLLTAATLLHVRCKSHAGGRDGNAAG